MGNVSCFSVAWVRSGMPMTVNLELSKHRLDCMCVHPALSHVTDSVWCPLLLDRITSIDMESRITSGNEYYGKIFSIMKMAE